MNKLFYRLLFVLGGVMGSCTTISTLSVDQLAPGDVSFPAEIRTVAVVDNLPYPPRRWPERYTALDTEKIIDGDGKKTTGSIAQYLADGNYFDQVLICDSALRENHSGKDFSPLEQEEVKKLSEELGADMIVSLDAAGVKVDAYMTYLYDMEQMAGVINATVSTVARLYIPSRKGPLTTLAYQDSIHWFTPSVDQDEILENSSDFVGSLLVRHLIPEWKSVNRYYYTGGIPELRDATYSIERDNWDAALASWQKLYNSGSRKKQKYAAFNMALYYEMRDDFDQAKEWLQKAMKLVPDSDKEPGYESSQYILMKSYLTELDRRKEEVQKLNLQMKRFGRTDGF